MHTSSFHGFDFDPMCLHALQYLTHALELKETYKQIKPHVEGLLVQVGVIFGQLKTHLHESNAALGLLIAVVHVMHPQVDVSTSA